MLGRERRGHPVEEGQRPPRVGRVPQEPGLADRRGRSTALEQVASRPALHLPEEPRGVGVTEPLQAEDDGLTHPPAIVRRRGPELGQDVLAPLGEQLPEPDEPADDQEFLVAGEEPPEERLVAFVGDGLDQLEVGARAGQARVLVEERLPVREPAELEAVVLSPAQR